MFLGPYYRLMTFCFFDFCSISALSCSFEFVWVGGWWVFPVITLSQPNYSYGCFVVGAVVVVGL